jgi:hypothetical protein
LFPLLCLLFYLFAAVQFIVLILSVGPFQVDFNGESISGDLWPFDHKYNRHTKSKMLFPFIFSTFLRNIFMTIQSLIKISKANF